MRLIDIQMAQICQWLKDHKLTAHVDPHRCKIVLRRKTESGIGHVVATL